MPAAKKPTPKRIMGTDGRKHVEQKKPHVPQKIIQKSGRVDRSRSTKKKD